MKTDYDEETDSLYISFVEIPDGGVATTCTAPLETGLMIQFDLGPDRKLLAIEILDASRVVSGGIRSFT
jgi:uncharacterized protein YuzE